MKVKDIYSEVARLGFETLLEDTVGFYQALNRALLQVASVRPEVKAVEVNHAPLQNLLSVGAGQISKHEGRKDLIFTAPRAAAYAFECDGIGEAYIEECNGENTWSPIADVSLDGNHGVYKAYKGVVETNGHPVRLRFSGNYTYYVKNVAVYSEVYSDKAEDVPLYNATCSYDISTLVDDFLALASPPISFEDGFKYLSSGYRVESGKRLVLPYEEKGIYNVQYYKRPRAINLTDRPTEDNAEIELDDEIVTLLPLRIAADVWLEDEPEKAQHYMSLYRERAEDMRTRTRNQSPIEYRLNGW